MDAVYGVEEVFQLGLPPAAAAKRLFSHAIMSITLIINSHKVEKISTRVPKLIVYSF